MTTMIEIKAGELILKVSRTSEGLKVVRAMVTLLEAEFTGEEKAKAPEEVAPIPKKDPIEVQPSLATPFSPAKPSPKQRIKYKDWQALAKTNSGIIYKEVVSRILDSYKDGIEPTPKEVSHIIREMYGGNLKDNSIASYTSQYRRYIREEKLAVKSPVKEFKPKTKELLPIEKVVEVWNLLPDKFTYKQVKALIPASIMQSAPRIETTNYIIKQFLENIVFECAEMPPGCFIKTGISKIFI